MFANSICNLRPAFIAKPVGSDDVSSVNRRCDGTIMGGSGCELVGESFKMFNVQVSRDSVCIIRSRETNRFSMLKIISMGGKNHNNNLNIPHQRKKKHPSKSSQRNQSPLYFVLRSPWPLPFPTARHFKIFLFC